MLTKAHLRAGSVLKGSGALLCSMTLTATITVWGVRPAEGNPPDDLGALEAKAEIEELGCAMRAPAMPSAVAMSRRAASSTMAVSPRML
jgi:hypothetical protein